MAVIEGLFSLFGYAPTMREFMEAAGFHSTNATTDAWARLEKKGRIGRPGLGRHSQSRALRLLRPLTTAERREHGLPTFETPGSYDTGMRCITCHIARLFDGITQCLECRMACDKSLPG